MTDKEKIEKLLDYLESIGDVYECDLHFHDEERWANRYDDEWCDNHCKWSSPQKECFRHFLLGE